MIGGHIVRTTVFNVVEGRIEPESSEAPPWAAPDEFGQAAAEIFRSPNGTSVLYSIPVGCTVPIHAGSNYAFCQIVAGRREIGPPGRPRDRIFSPRAFHFRPRQRCTVGLT